MLQKNRVYITLALALLLIIVAAKLRPDLNRINNSDEMQEGDFWKLKFRNPAKYDMIVMGDSRTYRSVNPNEIKKTLQGISIFNYAFALAQYDAEVLDSTESLLKKNSKNKILLLGITPMAFVGIENSQLHINLKGPMAKTAGFEEKFLSPHLHHFVPVDQSSLPDKIIMIGKMPQITIDRFFNDGWVIGYRYPEDTTQDLKVYRAHFEETKVIPAKVDSFMERVKIWLAKGIQVYAFKPPITHALDSLEHSMSGLDMPVFISAFEAAGGTWLQVDRTLYHNYDGGHIDDTSANKLSRSLAQQILAKQ